MNLKADFYRLIVLAVALTYGLCPAMAEESKKFKVLVVMSYEDDYPWVKEIREGDRFCTETIVRSQVFLYGYQKESCRR